MPVTWRTPGDLAPGDLSFWRKLCTQTGRERTFNAEGGRLAFQAHLCPPQQRLYFFVMLDGGFEGLKEI